ncbi:class F sortase [Arsenicicoccus piscis]|uniref:Sortase n=1 Tax=Arsenicicoccus piscis TaxID=673954 RepID=A0ABQ6HUQ0_9MICO|nr:class F sortase [Arsenicicoccus piscis]MCH8626738.1 class F sortase [Arsenicicoccus piscis]GMA21419.1 hypothetical protein GCM10025862_34400 [Arsenicicoccus piscis]
MKTFKALAGAALAATLLGGCGLDLAGAQPSHRDPSAATAAATGTEASTASASTSSSTSATSPTTAPAGTPATTAPTTKATTKTPATKAATNTPATTATTPVRDDGSRTISIPVLHVSAPVTTCAAQNGTVTPPSDIMTTCRWTGSNDFAAQQGSTVVLGHATYSDSSAGALEYVRELHRGDRVSVAGQTWQVDLVSPGVNKHSLPGWVSATTGPRYLVLLTCDTSEHSQNDLVRLVPVPAA